jgi:hypothetical protein
VLCNSSLTLPAWLEIDFSVNLGAGGNEALVLLSSAPIIPVMMKCDSEEAIDGDDEVYCGLTARMFKLVVSWLP